MKRSLRLTAEKILAEADEHPNRAYTAQLARELRGALSAPVYGVLAAVPGAIDAAKFDEGKHPTPKFRSPEWERLLFDMKANTESACRTVRVRTVRGLVERLHNALYTSHTSDEGSYSLPPGAPADRLAKVRTAALMHGLRDKGVKCWGPQSDGFMRLQSEIDRHWRRDTARFNDAAPRVVFVANSSFDSLGTDMEMLYALRTYRVEGRGYSRALVGEQAVPAQYWGAVVKLNGDEYVGVGRSKSAAAGKARTAAGASAAEALSGEFDGGFL